MKTRLARKIIKYEDRYSKAKVAEASRCVDRHFLRSTRDLRAIICGLPAAYRADRAMQLGWTSKAFEILMAAPEEKW